MESVLSRYRNLIVLVGVLFLQVLGLAMQVKRGSNHAQDTRLIRVWAIDVLTPFERGLVWLENSSGNVWHNYFYLRGVRAENRQLKEQIEQMRLEQVRLSEDAAQAHRLQYLLAFKQQYVTKTVAAQVIGSSGTDSSRVIYIDKGEKAGIARDMAVITADGIVGKVLLVYPSVSQVLLINDQSSGVGVILEKSRLQGVLRGNVSGEVDLERVMKDEDVSPGETVLTSGGDQIFPKGLPAGTVSQVEKGKDLFLNIKVKPAASLSKLEEVLVLVEKRERAVTAEDKAPLRAADILAQRLPSVPDKSANPAAGTTPATGTTPTTGTTGTVTSGPNGKPVTTQAGSPNAKPGMTLTASPNTNNANPGTALTAPPNAKGVPGTTVVIHAPAVSGQQTKPVSATLPAAQPKTAVPTSITLKPIPEPGSGGERPANPAGVQPPAVQPPPVQPPPVQPNRQPPVSDSPH
ncbi:MAG TPA: rod shape-determining protein MreC [Terracidiphilus sp.]